jgi:hypothetical protein
MTFDSRHLGKNKYACGSLKEHGVWPMYFSQLYIMVIVPELILFSIIR